MCPPNVLDGASVMQLLPDPFMNEGSLVNATRCRDLSDNGQFLATQRNRHAVSRAHEHGRRDLFELVVEIRHPTLMSSPAVTRLSSFYTVGLRAHDNHADT